MPHIESDLCIVPYILVPLLEPFPAKSSLNVDELLVPNEVKSTHLMLSEIDYPAVEVYIYACHTRPVSYTVID